MIFSRSFIEVLGEKIESLRESRYTYHLMHDLWLFGLLLLFSIKKVKRKRK